MAKDAKFLLKHPLSTNLDPIVEGTPKERHSALFFAQGEMKLLEGHSSGIEFFEYAESLDPLNAKLFTKMGLAITHFADMKEDHRFLLIANKKFKKGLKLNPEHFDAWHALARNLYNLGEKSEQFHYYLEAKEAFQKALEHSDLIEKDLLYDLYIELGSNMYKIASHSEEICDFNIAIDAFNQAKEMFSSHAYTFWLQFGKICLELADHVDDDRLYVQAIECFSAAVKANSQLDEQWFYLGVSLKHLYASTHDEDHFSRANECFASAAKINTEDLDLWAEWGDLLLQSGRRLKDAKRLSSAIEKCKIASGLDSEDEIVQAIWIESLATLGVLKDHIDYLHEAENKALELCELADLTPETLHAHGYSLHCFGQYFNDLDYYYQAIEKFQEGLSIDRTCHNLWYALGNTYSIAAAIENDTKMYEQAVSFFKKAINVKPLSLYYFEVGQAYAKLNEIEPSKTLLQMAIIHFEQAIGRQKSNVYLHPDWLFQYAIALDGYADLAEEESYYAKAIEILSHVLVSDPDHPDVHHKLGLVYSHYAEQILDTELYHKAFFHYHIATQNNEENDTLLLDWALTLINYTDSLALHEQKLPFLLESEYKMIQSAKLGNVHAYYHLACLYSILEDHDKAMRFIYKAQTFDALPTFEEMVDDAWLDNIKDTPDFQEFLTTIESGSEKQ